MGKNEVDFMPSKALFIDSLTKDIDIIECFFEFVDNSFKAYKALKEKENHYVEIEIDDAVDSKFQIKVQDNCGGFQREKAINEVFRLGNDSNIGKQGYGIGMKRALFKLSKNYTVISKCNNELFKVSMDIEKWKNKRDWNIPIRDLQKDNQKEKGVLIQIDLNDEIKSEILDSKFKKKLMKKLEERYMNNIDQRFKIKLCGSIINGSSKQVQKNLYKGPSFCVNTVEIKFIIYKATNTYENGSGFKFLYNGNLVEEFRSEFYSEILENKKLNNYDIGNFLGYVDMICDDISKVPVNVSKTEIIKSGSVYKKIISYLGDIMVDLKADFVSDERGITYKKKIVDIEKLKASYNTKSNADVGRKSFDDALASADNSNNTNINKSNRKQSKK